MITPRVVIVLGTSQLVCWGLSYYLIGVFGPLIVSDLGWSSPLVYGGFSVALVVMAGVSPLTGRLIDRHGGGVVMTIGSLLMAAGCAGLAHSASPTSYYAAWICLGVAMRLCRYDAAFATLARLAGRASRRPIAQVTLLGGLASSVFWPAGSLLSDALGWRAALEVYALIALATVPLHLAVASVRQSAVDRPNDGAIPSREGGGATPRGTRIAGALYASSITAISFLNSGMTAHMIGVLAGLGVAASMTVWVASLRGIGQSTARLCEVLFGSRLHPLTLNVIAASVLSGSIAAGMFSGQIAVAAIAFAFFYGAGNGLATITRGTVPLLFFAPGVYGTRVGWLLVPSFLVSASGPLVFAAIIDRFGAAGGLALSGACAATVLICAVALQRLFKEI